MTEDTEYGTARFVLYGFQTKINELKPLNNDIKVRFMIVNRKQTNAKKSKYCLLMYSEKNSFYLQNAGYMLEQIDFRKDISEFKRKPINIIWHGNYFLEIANYKITNYNKK